MGGSRSATGGRAKRTNVWKNTLPMNRMIHTNRSPGTERVGQGKMGFHSRNWVMSYTSAAVYGSSAMMSCTSASSATS
jgi:hypothetical protein